MSKTEVNAELTCYNAYDAVVTFQQGAIGYSAMVSPDNCNSRQGVFSVKLTAIFDDERKLLAVDNIELL